MPDLIYILNPLELKKSFDIENAENDHSFPQSSIILTDDLLNIYLIFITDDIILNIYSLTNYHHVLKND